MPTEQNTQYTNAELQAILDSIAQADAAIARVDTELARLISVRQGIQTFRDKQAALISPLRRVPNEILAEIMQQCISNRDGTYRQAEHRQHMALILAGVCSRWRSTAISTPQLWTRIICNDLNADFCLPLTRLMISRSGDCDLELHTYGYAHPHSMEFLEVIEPHLCRMKRIVDWGCEMSRSLVDDVTLCPDLRRLRVLRLDWGSQTTSILELFQVSPVLEEIQIRIDDDGRDIAPLSLGTVTMPRLYRLHLSYGTNPSALFESITTPNLKIFHTQFVNDQVPWPEGTFTQLLLRSNASLTTLGLAWSNGSTGLQICDMLNAAPNLEELHIDDYEEAMQVICQYLTIQPGSLPILTRLHTLIVRIYDNDVVPAELYAMISSRANEYPLKRVIFCENWTPNGDDLRLRSHIEEPFETLWKESERLGYSFEISHEFEYRFRFLDYLW